MSCGSDFTILINDKAVAVAMGDCGSDEHTDTAYVAAGPGHYIVISSSGQATAHGDNDYGKCSLPQSDIPFLQAAAGYSHSILLRRDNAVIACGDNEDGQCEVPKLPSGVYYTQVSAGLAHTLLLRSDGCVEAFGYNAQGQCNIGTLRDPAFPGPYCVYVAAGFYHSVLILNDGSAIGIMLGIPNKKKHRKHMF